LRIPIRLSFLACSNSCRPHPYSGCWISFAYVGLTGRHQIAEFDSGFQHIDLLRRASSGKHPLIRLYGRAHDI
jgi:hypothetical protein